VPIHAANSKQTPYPARTAAVVHAWMKKPRQVATIFPSSPALTHCIADRNCIRNAKCIVELGPGTGDTTAALLQHASPDSQVLAIELESEFIPALQSIADPRLAVQLGDAMDLEQFVNQHRFAAPDVIVSGIPFSAVPPATAHAIMANIARALPDNGVLIAYQLRSHVEQYARPFFDLQQVQTVWMNLPPLRVYQWTKRSVLRG